MKTKAITPLEEQLAQLCRDVRSWVNAGQPEKSFPSICAAMEQAPHAPQPHNLLGIVLEMRGDHKAAMRHFRAAWSLDPGYAPARHNLDTYGTFFTRGRCAFDETDLEDDSGSGIRIVYDANGIGQVVRNTVIEYDRYGIGHVVRR